MTSTGLIVLVVVPLLLELAQASRKAVLKPADSGGQRGLFMIEEPGDVEHHLGEALSFSASGQAMLEEYVDGIELNGIIVVRDGRPTLVTLSDRLRPAPEGESCIIP